MTHPVPTGDLPRSGEGPLAVDSADFPGDGEDWDSRESVRRLLSTVADLRARADLERRRLDALLAIAPTPIVVFEGPDHRLTFMNPQARQLTRSRSVLGLRFLEAFPEGAERPFRDALDEVYRTGAAVTLNDYHLSWSCDDGSSPGRYFKFTLGPLRDEAGAVSGILVVGMDVTEQVESRARLDAARAEAEEANRAKDEFLAMLGHELRNPLAPIVTALHLLRVRGGSEGHKEQRVIERQVGHLVRLVDDLLDVSRITRGKLTLKKQRLELSTVVASAIEMASPLLEQKAHHLEVDVPKADLVVLGDAVRLAQVVSNLLTNASKYTAPGGHILVSAARDGDEIVLRVRDEGSGISPEMLPRIFDLFTQARQSLERSDGGLGLGLTIVKSLVHLHGGRVTAHSEGPSRGSEFVIHLPAVDDDGPPASRRLGASAASRWSRQEGTLRVLVVDDNEDAAESLADILRSEGYETRVAYDGPEALAAAEEMGPDAVLLDIGLPVVDGYEVARRLRSSSKARGATLIAVTGYGQAVDREEAKKAGFDVHLVKPVDVDAVLLELGALRSAKLS